MLGSLLADACRELILTGTDASRSICTRIFHTTLGTVQVPVHKLGQITDWMLQVERHKEALKLSIQNSVEGQSHVSTALLGVGSFMWSGLEGRENSS